MRFSLKATRYQLTACYSVISLTLLLIYSYLLRFHTANAENNK